MKKRFLIPSLLAAGFSPAEANDVESLTDTTTDAKSTGLFDVFQLTHKYQLAAHRSHSSHSSHGSHGSHRSSSGGGYSAPRTTSPSSRGNSTAPSSVLPSSPSRAQPTLPGNSEKFRQILMKVQTGLFAYGFYTGNIDGIMGPQTRAALSKMQANYGLPVTGTVTPEVLNALRITAE